MNLLWEIDLHLQRLINHALPELLDAPMVFLSTKAYVPLLAFFIPLAFALGRRTVAVAAVVLGASALADWAGLELKEAVARLRPCQALEDVRLLVGCGESFSMPSNHASVAFAFATAMVLWARRRWLLGVYAVAFLIALSRVYVGVHYPSDILVGGALGTAVGALVVGLARYCLRRGYPGALALLLIGVGLFRLYYILHGPLGLSPDEAHYWEFSRQLDIGYYSKGPVVAYLIWAGTKLLGATELGVRLPAVILSALSGILIYRLGSLLYEQEVGLYAAALQQIVPLFATYGLVMTIDAPLMFFWTLALLLFFRAVSLSGWQEWLLLGVAVGLGLLTKYTMAFFVLSAFLYLLASRPDRRHLASAGPWLALLVSLLLLSPLLLWDAQHGWVNLKHNLGHAELKKGFAVELRSFGEFLGSQAGVLSPLIFVAALYGVFRNRAQEQALGLYFTAPMFVFFLLKSLQGDVEANWAMPAYLAALPAAAAVLFRGAPRGSLPKKALAALALLLALLVSAAAHYPQVLKLPPRLDPTARLRGWEPLAQKVHSLLPPEPRFILAERYQVASLLAFYMPGQPRTYCLDLGRRMNQYDLWSTYHGLRNYNAVFVKIGPPVMPRALREAFQSCQEPHTLVLKEGPHVLRQYAIFVCRGFRGMKKAKFRSF